MTGNVVIYVNVFAERHTDGSVWPRAINRVKDSKPCAAMKAGGHGSNSIC